VSTIPPYCTTDEQLDQIFDTFHLALDTLLAKQKALVEC